MKKSVGLLNQFEISLFGAKDIPVQENEVQLYFISNVKGIYLYYNCKLKLKQLNDYDFF